MIYLLGVYIFNKKYTYVDLFEAQNSNKRKMSFTKKSRLKNSQMLFQCDDKKLAQRNVVEILVTSKNQFTFDQLKILIAE